ncbi:hypothetical protein [Burkholderia gladioli]|uniref:hypothetical protein n=1 Tax=Burkholderia gladioli TaxID=28095 RepID=UPI0034DB3009
MHPLSHTERPATRFIIECTWTGYTSSQQKVVHRSVHPIAEKKLRAWAENTYCIRYTDGTALVLEVRDCKPRERVDVRAGYMKLIRDCAHYGVSSVEALMEAEAGARRARRA